MIGICDPKPGSWHHWQCPDKMDFCGRACKAALLRRKKSRSEEFLIVACIRYPHHCYCPSRVEDVFAALGATFSSSHRSLTVEPFDRFAQGMHDPSSLNGFHSCERCSHCPHVVYFGPSLVRDSENCPVVRNLHVQFGADLILPFFTVSLVET